MDENRRPDSGISPSRELAEHLKRAAIWIGEEMGGEPEDAFDVVKDVLRELRDYQEEEGEPPSPTSIAEKIEDAGAAFRLLKLAYPDGRTSVADLKETLLLRVVMRERELDHVALKSKLESLLEVEGLGAGPVDLVKGFMVYLQERCAKNGKSPRESMRQLIDKVFRGEDLDVALQEKRDYRDDLEKQCADLEERAAELDSNVGFYGRKLASLKRYCEDRGAYLSSLEEEVADLRKQKKSMESQLMLYGQQLFAQRQMLAQQADDGWADMLKAAVKNLTTPSSNSRPHALGGPGAAS